MSLFKDDSVFLSQIPVKINYSLLQIWYFVIELLDDHLSLIKFFTTLLQSVGVVLIKVVVFQGFLLELLSRLLVFLYEFIDVLDVGSYAIGQNIVLLLPVVAYSFTNQLFYLLLSQDQLSHDFFSHLFLLYEYRHVEIVLLSAYLL